MWEEYFQKLSRNDNGMFAYYLGITLQKVGKQPEAMEYFQQVLDRWPNYSQAWDAHFRIAQYADELGREGKISSVEADERTRLAYEQIIKLYPNSPVIPIAQRWLNIYRNSKR
jgi:tetratricopeptide (TPR) repeat protein